MNFGTTNHTNLARCVDMKLFEKHLSKNKINVCGRQFDIPYIKTSEEQVKRATYSKATAADKANRKLVQSAVDRYFNLDVQLYNHLLIK